MSADFEYKCQRCGKISNPSGTYSDLGISYLCDTVAFQNKEPRQENTPLIPYMNVHLCDDGGSGISLLIGFSDSDMTTPKQYRRNR